MSDNVIIVDKSATAAATQAALAANAASASAANSLASAVAAAASAAAVLTNYVNVLDFDAVADDETDNTVAFAAALSHINELGGGTLKVPAGTYRGHFLIRQNNIAIIGDGSHCTTIKLPDDALTTQSWEPGGTVTGVPNVIEVGQCAMGNNAAVFSGIKIAGLTLDGNFAETTAPAIDLFGSGLTTTKSSYCNYSDIKAVNCHSTGISLVINSNYNSVQGVVDNCGFSTEYPGFDVNSSNGNTINAVILNSCYGARVLDNSYNNIANFAITNAENTGFVMGNQSVNRSDGNLINLVVLLGCKDYGVMIGDKVYSTQIKATIVGVDGIGCASVNRNAIPGSSNIFNITTGNCGANSCVIESHNEIWTITSLDDGTDKDVGEINAVQIYGSNNVLNVSITDSRLVPIVRGVAFESTAQNNNLSAYQYSGVVSIYQDAGTNNVWQGDNIFHWSAPSFASGWGNAFGSPYTAAGYIRDPFGVVRLKGVVSGGTGVIFTLPTGYRPKDTLVVPAGESNVEIAANGEVFATAKSGVTRWVLGGVAFNTRSSLT